MFIICFLCIIKTQQISLLENDGENVPAIACKQYLSLCNITFRHTMEQMSIKENIFYKVKFHIYYPNSTQSNIRK